MHLGRGHNLNIRTEKAVGQVFWHWERGGHLESLPAGAVGGENAMGLPSLW